MYDSTDSFIQELIDNSSGTIFIVNPLRTLWSYQITSEVALRCRQYAKQVYFIDLAPRPSRKYEVNRKHFIPLWRYYYLRNRIKSILEEKGIYFVSKSNYKWLNSHRFRAFRTIDELRNFNLAGVRLGHIIFSAVSSARKSTSFNILTVKNSVSYHLKVAFHSQYQIKKLISQLNPDVVITTNDRLVVSSLALQIADTNGVKTAIAYWGSSTDRIQLYKKSLYDSDEWQEHVRTFWSKSKKDKVAIKLASESVNKLSKGPSSDSLRYTRAQTSGYIPKIDNQTVVFYAQSEYEHSAHFIPNTQNRFSNQYLAFDCLQKVTHDLGIKLILKYHPLPNDVSFVEESNQLLDWKKVNFLPHVSIIEPNSQVDTYSLMRKAACNVIWSSTVGLEAISRSLPLIVLGNPHWLNQNWEINAWNKKQLKSKIENLSYLPRLNQIDIIPWFLYLQNFGDQVKYSFLKNGSLMILGKEITFVKPKFFNNILYR